MNSIFKICSTSLCSVKIHGLEEIEGLYLNEGSDISYRNYEFLQSVTLNIIKKVSYNKDVDIKEILIVHHVDSDISDYTFVSDGLHEISHIILPTKEYVDRLTKEDIDKYSLIYYYNLEDGNFYKLLNGDNIKVNIEEIIEIDLDDSTVVKSTINTFCICYLLKCLYKLNKMLLDEFCGKCLNKLSYSKEKVVNRDLILMAINVIKYLIETDSYFEAQRILESITQCGSICDNLNTEKANEGCGCG